MMDSFGGGWEKDCPVFCIKMLSCVPETGGVEGPGDTDSKAGPNTRLMTTTALYIEHCAKLIIKSKREIFEP